MPRCDWAVAAMFTVTLLPGRKGASGLKLSAESLSQLKLPDRTGSPLSAPSTEARSMAWLK